MDVSKIFNKTTTCERCGLTGLDPDELSPTYSSKLKYKMWCDICWEEEEFRIEMRTREIEDFKDSGIV